MYKTAEGKSVDGSEKDGSTEDTTTSTQQTENTGNAPEQTEDNGSNEPSVESLQAKFEEQRKHARTWEKRAADNEKKLKEQIEKNGELQKEIDGLNTDLANKDREVLVSKVSGEEGVAARFLEGETEEELRESAKAFLKEYRPVSSNPGGFVGSHGDADDSNSTTRADPRERAKNYKI